MLQYIYTLVSLYYDTAGKRKKYHYIQTIEISSINFYCFVIVGILIWYHNKQHFELSDIVITRDYCNLLIQCVCVETLSLRVQSDAPSDMNT